MAGAPHWNFAAFRLDLDNACVWHGTELLALRPKTFTVLLHLVTHAGQLVTKEALLEAVWPQTAVSDTVLKDCMHELRRVLGDTARTPQLIATVHRRGYRFIAPVTVMESVATTEAQTMRSGERVAFTPALALPSVSGHAPTSSLQLVARETEIATLHQWFTKAHQGERHLGFLTGEAGIGKTTLVNAFVAQCAGQGPLWLGHGQCIEQYGTGEAYLPLLAALGQMGRSPDGPQLVALLRQHAPSWLLHLPALLSPQDAEALQRYAGGTTRERMLRELAEAMEVLTADRPGILVLEDLHWGDTATIEWLAYMARRRRPARLLVLGTYRPVEALVRVHPVRAMVQELTLHGYGAELALGEWSEVGVAAYLAHRGAGTAGHAALARVLTQRTEGHPLFLATVVDELLRQGVVRVEPTGWVLTRELEAVTAGVPPSLRAWLEHQIAQLRPEAQGLLAAASVAGVEFAVAAVAAAVRQAEEEVETQCDALARQYQVVQARGTVLWPDGTVTARYGFRHALYQELLYDQVPVSRRLRWHQQIGRRHEAGYGDRAWEVAAELAMHFGRGQDAPRAVRYLRQAADNALRRAAPSAAIRALTQAQALVSLLSDAHEQARQELAIQLTLGAACVATQGAGAPAVAQAYARALELSQQVGEPSQRCLALLGVAWVALVRGQALNAQELAAQALAHGHALPDSVGRASAHSLLGSAMSFLGALKTARRHLEQSLLFLHIQQSPAPGITRPEESGGVLSRPPRRGLMAPRLPRPGPAPEPGGVGSCRRPRQSCEPGAGADLCGAPASVPSGAAPGL